jgi:carbon-monoxide dehydrogenase medium subunit
VRNRGTIGGSLANGDAAAALAAEGTNPSADLNATPDYKRHLVRALTRRALTTARAA